jgi:hypothetical protein
MRTEIRIVLGLAALTLVFASPSFAARKQARHAVITCSNAKLDVGFILTAAGRGDKFSIQEQTIGGPLQIAVATCRAVATQPAIGADTMHLSQICRGAGARGDQFEVQISSGGFFFHQTADLLRNGKLVADDMFCAQNPTE